MDTVINAVNLQNTGWSINPTVFEVASYLWDETDGGRRRPSAAVTATASLARPAGPPHGYAAARVRAIPASTPPREDFNEWKREAFRIRRNSTSACSDNE